MTTPAAPPVAAAPALPRRLFTRGMAIQGALLVFVVWLGRSIVGNAQANMASRGLSFGFGSLDRSAGIPIGEALIACTPADTYARALLVGLLNTLRVAVIGCILCTALGVLLVIARLSSNPLLRGLVGAYVEVIRNTPLVLQLVFCHAIVLRLPPVRQALNPLPGLYPSQRGMKLPALVVDRTFWLAAATLAAGIVGWMALLHREPRCQAATGDRRSTLLAGAMLSTAMPAAVASGLGGLGVEWPVLRGFNFQGGLAMSPEFVALLAGLTIHTAAFVAEIVRAGVQSVPRGQWEAARALGLPPGRIMRLLILPQALRLIIPPQTSQYLNLTKNPSLAVVIGYPDLVSNSNTSINRTGQAVEVITIFMAVYLAVSLATSAGMDLSTTAPWR